MAGYISFVQTYIQEEKKHVSGMEPKLVSTTSQRSIHLTMASLAATTFCKKKIFFNCFFLTQNFTSFFSRRLLVERAPDGLRVDGHQVGGEGDEVVAGGLGREVAGLPVHDVVSVHLAERTEKKTPNDSRLCIFTKTTAI